METKSRYEVINELEQQKREFLERKQQLKQQLRDKRVHIRNIERGLEDLREEIKEFEQDIPDREIAIDAMIESVNQGLERMSAISQSPRK